MTAHPLDDPVRAALSTRQAPLAVREGAAWRFPTDISPFITLPAEPTEADWADLSTLLARTGPGAIVRPSSALPDGWSAERQLQVAQMVAQRPIGTTDPELVHLGIEDVDAMLDLVRRTAPGPFLPRTVELGTYLGLRDGHRLIAMAGERLSADGWTEISAVCSDPAYRGRGLAPRLMRAVAAGIEARGQRPFLHVLGSNATAIRVYERLGFVTRRELIIDELSDPRGHELSVAGDPGKAT